MSHLVPPGQPQSRGLPEQSHALPGQAVTGSLGQGGVGSQSVRLGQVQSRGLPEQSHYLVLIMIVINTGQTLVWLMSLSLDVLFVISWVWEEHNLPPAMRQVLNMLEVRVRHRL